MSIVQGPADPVDSSAGRARPTAGRQHAAGDHDPEAGERRHTPPQGREGASTVCDLRRRVTASLLGSYEHLDRLERQLAQLRESCVPGDEQNGGTSSDNKLVPGVTPVDMRAYIGAALSLVPGLLGTARSSTGTLSGTAVLDNLQHNLLVTMETIGDLLVEVSLHERLTEVDLMDVTSRAKVALDRFVAGPVGL